MRLEDKVRGGVARAHGLGPLERRWIQSGLFRRSWAAEEAQPLPERSPEGK